MDILLFRIPKQTRELESCIGRKRFSDSSGYYFPLIRASKQATKSLSKFMSEIPSLKIESPDLTRAKIFSLFWLRDTRFEVISVLSTGDMSPVMALIFSISWLHCERMMPASSYTDLSSILKESSISEIEIFAASTIRLWPSSTSLSRLRSTGWASDFLRASNSWKSECL